MSIELFSLTWNNKNLSPEFININVLTHNQIGEVAMPLNCLQTINIDNVWKEEDYYKILSLIHEKTILGKPYFIYKEDDNRILEKLGAELNKFTPIERSDVLRDFPKNIIELQRRSLFMLYKQSPKYGDDVGNVISYDFFAGDYTDYLFVLETMLRKNWIDVKIKKGGDGKFIYSKPFLIAEDGWFEIEKELKMNYSKQVFVAMWFDKKMDKAAQKIAEAIKDCDLKVMRIDRKEHNNEISGEILFEIMNSRIIIADVTGQRNGVYFEAGFALGHKKSVIWLCKNDDKDHIHFDTRQYNHILWENEEELYIKLKDRILATLAIEDK